MKGHELRRILLVEDDPDIQLVASLARAPGFAPDLIVMDVMMPGMDGPSALEALRGLPETAGTPVVFMTAKVQPQEIAHYRALGSLGVISKPFDPATLAERVRDLWQTDRG